MKAWLCILFFLALTEAVRGADVAPPSPPMPSSPIDEFRNLLQMREAERSVALASRSPRSRQVIEEKVKQYGALSPADRERRLKVMEIHWHLRPLLDLAATNRAQAVVRLPETVRPIVEDRLRRWDRLAPHVRSEMLTNETAIALLIEPPPPPMPPMPNAFDQKDMERTLENYARLSPTQRRQCIESFARLATMHPAERNTFLKNAERWQEMSKVERDAWRQLVSLRPPLPPGFDAPTAPFPR